MNLRDKREIEKMNCKLISDKLYTFSKYLITKGVESNLSILISIITVTIILSYFLLIFGSVIPKRLARNNPEKTAYGLINILSFLAIINFPFEKLVTFSSKIFCKIFRIVHE